MAVYFIISPQLLLSSILLWNKILDLPTSFRNNYDPILRKLQGWLWRVFGRGSVEDGPRIWLWAKGKKKEIGATAIVSGGSRRKKQKKYTAVK